jgi:ABC-type Zn uptake system ZnuABC Zn-binding protein ZnuA
LVTVYNGIELMEVPETFSRTQGDIHVYGNPHLWTDPANAIIIGRNILTGLKRVSPENSTYFDQRFDAWRKTVLRAYVGDQILQLLGADAIEKLGEQASCWTS